MDAVKKNRGRTVRIILFFLALAFTLYGWSRGEAETVFTKAARVCLECIGIG